ncbi:hypothetical protein [Sandaracinobacteroides hominis]|uniref:hypothetical protein n=1 Tax=Sandaracinobacteroides hominis TaxID=2780086 RepID=UPI0018F666F7|nr:hypothetical protein [Sandaracinobacteroides hominis]
MTKLMIAAMAALVATGAAAQVTETPPANPANMPMAEPAAPPAAGPDEARIRADLSASGYTDLQGLSKDGDGWKGTAMHGGKRVPVKIGADGKLVPQK